MPRLIDSSTRTGALVAAVNDLLAEGGPRAVSARSVARESRVSASSILHHLGSMEHLMRVCAHWTGRARREQLDRRWHAEGLLTLLPRTPDEVVEARTWLAWCELWRSDPSLEQTCRRPATTSAPSWPAGSTTPSTGPASTCCWPWSTG